MESVKSGAAEWFGSMIPAFEGTIYEEYLRAAIDLFKTDPEVDVARKDPILDVPLIRFKYNELSARAYNCLRLANVATMRDFTYVTKRNILGIRNCGRQTARHIFDFAENHGVSIRDDCIFMRDVFHFKKGDTVIVRSADNKSYHAKEGDVMIIRDVDERYYNQSMFRLPKYKCEGGQGVEWFSPGQIRKYKEV